MDHCAMPPGCTPVFVARNMASYGCPSHYSLPQNSTTPAPPTASTMVKISFIKTLWGVTEAMGNCPSGPPATLFTPFPLHFIRFYTVFQSSFDTSSRLRRFVRPHQGRGLRWHRDARFTRRRRGGIQLCPVPARLELRRHDQHVHVCAGCGKQCA